MKKEKKRKEVKKYRDKKMEIEKEAVEKVETEQAVVDQDLPTDMSVDSLEPSKAAKCNDVDASNKPETDNGDESESREPVVDVEATNSIPCVSTDQLDEVRAQVN